MTSKEDVADLLDQAANEIRERGWAQRTLETSRGRVCAIGGIWAACTTLHKESAFAAWAEAAFAEYLEPTAVARSVGVTSIVIDWNDDKSRTKEDVTNALEKAAAQVREQA